MTRRVAADRLAITPAYLGRLERSEVPLTLRLARRMAVLYETSLSALVRGGRGDRGRSGDGEPSDGPTA